MSLVSPYPDTSRVLSVSACWLLRAAAACAAFHFHFALFFIFVWCVWCVVRVSRFIFFIVILNIATTWDSPAAHAHVALHLKVPCALCA